MRVGRDDRRVRPVASTQHRSRLIQKTKAGSAFDKDDFFGLSRKFCMHALIVLERDEITQPIVPCFEELCTTRVPQFEYVALWQRQENRETPRDHEHPVRPGRGPSH